MDRFILLKEKELVTQLDPKAYKIPYSLRIHYSAAVLEALLSLGLFNCDKS